MNRTILFFRHGETQFPIDEKTKQTLNYGPEDPLTQAGEADVSLVGERVATLLPDMPKHMFVSPYRRAKQSATILQRWLQFPEIHYDSDLREVDTPTFVGKVAGSNPKNIYQEPLPPGHESLAQVAKRGSRAFHRILDEYSAEPVIAVVGHRDPILTMVYEMVHPDAPIPLSREGLLPDLGFERGDALLFVEKQGRYLLEAHIVVDEIRRLLQEGQSSANGPENIK